ncbi:hypothetical protein ENSA5_12070 [Enhygromyxa salina]|uniref:YHYH domain-containing protein n=1 Tax=Enhygromyxa salina TaxID=215803 RepID=A0A2S9YFE2_9BACT|nr:YHYH protein [Enhygromyxa salina]PRQ03838.1 hypothetical protein ENSA5_12070 [Enhygromyxa salina]
MSLALLSACNGTPADDSAAESETGETGGEQLEGLDPENFLEGGLDGAITEVQCTLSNGETTTCYSIPIAGAPANHDVGPFCPRTIDDGPEAVGIWLDSGEVFDVDGAFIVGLAEYYMDDVWQLYDPDTGEVYVTDSQDSCEAAAKPDVEEEYNNHCVECSLDYYGGGVSDTVLIPQVPVARETPGEIDGVNSVGVALNGVTLDPPAPVDAILAAHTIAAFDDCGGHVNPVAGYHYHAATGCHAEVPAEDHAPLIGYVSDGYGIYAMSDEYGVEPDDLDECRGHSDESRGYHYHAASPGENMFIGCFHGEVVDDGEGGGGGGGGGMDILDCADVPEGAPCCGDGLCDGAETAANCAEDCA